MTSKSNEKFELYNGKAQAAIGEFWFKLVAYATITGIANAAADKYDNGLLTLVQIACALALVLWIQGQTSRLAIFLFPKMDPENGGNRSVWYLLTATPVTFGIGVLLTLFAYYLSGVMVLVES